MRVHWCLWKWQLSHLTGFRHPIYVFLRKGLAYFSKTMLNLILNLLLPCRRVWVLAWPAVQSKLFTYLEYLAQHKTLNLTKATQDC